MYISLILILSLIALDQYTKYWIESSGISQIDLIPGFIELKYSQNTGVAFSLFDNHPLILTIVNSLIIVVFIIYFIKNYSPSIYKNLPAILIIAGGLGNLIDRYTKGYVIDFINPTFVDFAIFNLADCFLNIGVFLLVLEYGFNAKSRN